MLHKLSLKIFNNISEQTNPTELLNQNIQNVSFSNIRELIGVLSNINSFFYLLIILSCSLLFISLILYFVLDDKKNRYIFNILIIINKITILNYFFILIIKIVLANLLSKYTLIAASVKFLNINTIKLGYIFSTYNIYVTNSILSDAILLLSLVSGSVCLVLLGEKNIISKIYNINLFLVFFIVTSTMVYTTNLLVMFISFEFLFLPTIYYAYISSYTKRSDKSVYYLLTWTVIGAVSVLIVLSYIYYQYKTLNYQLLTRVKFSENESSWISLVLLLSFCIKLPTFPFHFWLTKIHVEAPAGFSIFLSGFLVKTALFCLISFNNLFFDDTTKNIGIFMGIIGIADAAFKLWVQTDFKKTVAYCTILEMNMLLCLFLSLGNNYYSIIVLFLLMHGVLSTLMFFLVDVVQKKTKTRNIVEITGLSFTVPKLRIYIWIILFFISGFPLTVKFLAESALIGSLLIQGYYIFIFYIVVFLAIATIAIVKQFIALLYNVPSEKKIYNPVINNKEKYIFNFLILTLILLTLYSFYL